MEKGAITSLRHQAIGRGKWQLPATTICNIHCEDCQGTDSDHRQCFKQEIYTSMPAFGSPIPINVSINNVFDVEMKFQNDKW